MAWGLQLQETGAIGAEGKDHLVVRNSGEVKRVLMGSLAGPESPNPWSHSTKLRAAAMDCCFWEEEGFFGCKKTDAMKMAVLKRRVNEKIAIGLLLAVSVSRTWCIVFGLPWRLPFYIFVLPKPNRTCFLNVLLLFPNFLGLVINEIKMVCN